MRRAMRLVIPVVLPVPAPATIKSGPSPCVAASSCSEFNPPRVFESVFGAPPERDLVFCIAQFYHSPPTICQLLPTTYKLAAHYHFRPVAPGRTSLITFINGPEILRRLVENDNGQLAC